MTRNSILLATVALVGLAGAVAPAFADPYHHDDEGWRRHNEWREHEAREHEWRGPYAGYYRPPPPVVYAPPPGLHFGFNIP